MTILELVDAVGSRHLKQAVGLVLAVGAIVVPGQTSAFLVHEVQAASSEFTKALLQSGENAIHRDQLELKQAELKSSH